MTAKAGQHLPLHAGAARKFLLGNLPAELREEVLGQPLSAFTAHTLTDRTRLDAEIEVTRRQGWSYDCGEFSTNVHSYGAPIFDSRKRVIAAVSSAYLAGKTAEEADGIRRHVIATAEDISAEILSLNWHAGP